MTRRGAPPTQDWEDTHSGPDPEVMHVPRSLFSRRLERKVRQAAFQAAWRDRKSMVLAFHAVDFGGAVFRALAHVVVWVPAIVIWPLLLSSNGVAAKDIQAWLMEAGSGGWEGALWKLSALVFLASLSWQLLTGAVGARLRGQMDRWMERSMLWELVRTQLPGVSAPLAPAEPPAEEPPRPDPV